MNDQARFAEAVAALTSRLDAWGVADPHDKAHAYVADMRRRGWRPVGYRYEEPQLNPRRTPPPPDALALARAELARVRAATCSHGVTRATCHDDHTEEA